jgi:ferrous iron transport protein B
VFTRLGRRGRVLPPFFMEMPPYRLPSVRSVLLAMWDSSRAFVRKCSTIILTATLVLWLLLNLPLQSGAALARAQVETGDQAAVTAYTVDHSYAAAVGRFVSPVFEPLGFDWRINVGVLSAQSARETFVATLGQVAAAQDPEAPADALRAMTYTEGPRTGQPLFNPPTIAALFAYFAYALQCMATVGVMRRETGTWKWPLIAFGAYTALAWVMALLAHTVVAALVG